MPCKVCLHPRRSEIEQQIADRTLTQSRAAIIVSCHNSTVSRHMRFCVAPHVAELARREARELQAIDVIHQLAQSHQTTQRILEKALSEGKERVALKALEVEIKQLELSAKLTGQLNEAPQVNLLMNPEFMKLKQIIVKQLAPFPEARLALSEALDDIAEDVVEEDNEGSN